MSPIVRTGSRWYSRTGHFPSFGAALRRVQVALALARQRQHLAELDDHLLRDIGLDRRDAKREASRPIWDVPPHWLRKD